LLLIAYRLGNLWNLKHLVLNLPYISAPSLDQKYIDN